MASNLPILKDVSCIILHGLGVEGRAALPWLLQATQADIIIVDAKQHTDLAPRLSSLTEEQALKTALKGELYLRSPGIAPSNAFYQKMQQAKMPTTTPTGLWLDQGQHGKIITVTGTKGKSTTTSLIASLLSWGGLNAEPVGNIGTPPFTKTFGQNDIAVVELSSYMMHDIPLVSDFHVVTNLYKEHTDWHGTHSLYARDKLRPFFERSDQAGIIGRNVLPYCADALQQPPIVEELISDDGDELILPSGYRFYPAAQNELFRAPSMRKALQTAIAACLSYGAVDEPHLIAALEKNLPSFVGLPSRQNIISHAGSRLWVDDALATVPEAALSAIIRFADRPIHLLLGGKDRGQEFTSLCEALKSFPALKLYAFSETAPKLCAAAAQAGLPQPVQADTLEALIEAAWRASVEGDVILFSPAAPSAPPHANYLERAAIFAAFAHQPPPNH